MSSAHAFAPKGPNSIAQGAALGRRIVQEFQKVQRTVTRWRAELAFRGPLSRPVGPSSVGVDSLTRAAPWAFELGPFGASGGGRCSGRCSALSEWLGLRPVKRRVRWNKTDLDVSARLCRNVPAFAQPSPRLFRGDRSQRSVAHGPRPALRALRLLCTSGKSGLIFNAAR